jgi:hypothetical protein
MKEMLRVTYDTELKVLMMSPSAWTATGPLQWFSKYRIISSMDNPLAAQLKIINIGRYLPKGEALPKTTKEIMASPGLRTAIRDNQLEGYRHILNRASPLAVSGVNVGNRIDIASRFENKIWFRQTFGDVLQFPKFQIISIKEMLQKGLGGLLQVLEAEKLVVQHPSFSGGQGTYFVSDQTDFDNCIESLLQHMKSEDLIVVSKKLQSPCERTLQVCVTKSTILVGPAQAQLVGHPLLTSTRQGDIQFCGGRIMPGLLSDRLYDKAHTAARTVGERLQHEGYRGIFGMDFMVSEQNIYVLEANPRMTGLTTLLAFLQRKVPFLLLHILELTSSTYKIEEPVTNEYNISGSFIQVYAQQDGIINFETGVYDSSGKRQGEGFEDGTIFPSASDNFFVAMRVTGNQHVARGKSLAFIYSRKQLFNDEGFLDEGVLVIIRKIRQQGV